MSLTYKEIRQQYTALQLTFDYMLAKKEEIVQFVHSCSINSVTFVGCGSSYCLSESAAFSAVVRAGLPSSVLAGGDLMLNFRQYSPILRNTLLIAPSRSGSTSEVVEAVRRIKAEHDVPVLAISCVTDSPLSRKSDFALELPWAFDHSVCQTRTVTNLYIANLMLTAFLGNDERVIAEIKNAILQGEAYMAATESEIRKAADGDWNKVILLADGELYGLASEGAIALTEIAKVQAHAFHLLDVRHGPMVTVGSDTLVIAAITGDDTKYQLNLLQDIKDRGATIIALADHESSELTGIVDLAIVSEHPLDAAALGIPFIFIPQIVAIHQAERLNINPDEPDGLVAWVEL
ncbi:SIS domain-containing protein [Paenibacillus sp. sgz500958]|uniref:SIS domain-containing protein n=1 Tax=Paenibacillus sp. sgz500958 TaxID=3242475 RepID=UPI0036D26E34